MLRPSPTLIPWGHMAPYSHGHSHVGQDPLQDDPSDPAQQQVGDPTQDQDEHSYGRKRFRYSHTVCDKYALY